MTLSKGSGLHTQPFQLTDTQTKSWLASQSYLTIQDRVIHLISERRPCLHLSLNPLSGNTLY